MADHDSERRGEENSDSDQSHDDSHGPITISTTDPVIETASDRPSDWRIHSDSTVRVETTHQSETNPLYFPGIRNARAANDPVERRPTGGDSQDKSRRDAATKNDDYGDHPANRPSPPAQPSMINHVFMTAGIALVCGVIGAFGYSYFFGSKAKESSSYQSQAKSNSGSQQGGASPKTGAKSGKTGSDGKSKSSDKNLTAGSSSAAPVVPTDRDLETQKQQIMGLTQRLGRLGERVDRLRLPKDATPPILRMMEVKFGELTRLLNELGTLPAEMQKHDIRLESLRQDFNVIRARFRISAGSFNWRNSR